MTDRVPHDFASGEVPTAAMFDALPAGELSLVELTSDVSFTTEEIISGLATWVQVPQSRRMKITADVRVRGQWGGTTVAGDLSPTLRIYHGSGTQIARADATMPDSPVVETVTVHAEARHTQAAGSLQYYATIQNSSYGYSSLPGSILASGPAPAFLVVDDMGSVT